jgi:hypothetical protein
MSVASNKGRPVMSGFESKYTAQNMMAVHGLRAQAVVHERVAEARQQGDTSSLERWQNVEAAISELRRTAPRRAPGE